MKILILGGKGESTNAVVNALSEKYSCISLILENGVPMVTFLKKRMKRLGLGNVLGQLIFRAFVPRCLRYKSRKRIDEIIRQYGLNIDFHYRDAVNCHFVGSVNDDETIEKIKSCKPDIIVVNGTRIISEKVLNSLSVPIINMHVGITPKYRGVHGGYWALANGDRENCGVTVHMVNAGIDTGDVIRQKRIEVEKEDNFVTYPYIQVGEGIRLELEILEEFAKTGKIETKAVELPSMIWSHPTIWQYVKNRRRSR